MLSVIMLSVIMECRYVECHYAECHYAQCHLYIVSFLQSAADKPIMLSVLMECCYGECCGAPSVGTTQREKGFITPTVDLILKSNTKQTFFLKTEELLATKSFWEPSEPTIQA
jgi:hypothetical protein